MSSEDDQPFDHQSILDTLKDSEAFRGDAIPSMTSASRGVRVYGLEDSIDELLVKRGMSREEAIATIKKLTSTFLGQPNPIFVSEYINDLPERVSFSLVNRGDRKR